VHQVERWAPRMSELRRMVDFAFITNSGTAIAETCAKGGGIGILPSFMSVLDPRLVPLDLPELAPIRFWINYTERVRRLPQGQALIDWIRQLFETRRKPSGSPTSSFIPATTTRKCMSCTLRNAATCELAARPAGLPPGGDTIR
jgi:hypothetical protein